MTQTMDGSTTRISAHKRNLLVDGGLALLIASAAFFLYLRTLAPGLLSGDSGEFQVLTSMLGPTHTTGYPIYLLLAHPFTFAGWTELYPLYYAAHVVQDRQDLTFLEEKPYREGAADENSTIQYVEARIVDHPIYFTECLPELRAAGYRCEPERLGTSLYQRVRLATNAE
jgi:hypothetical protein